MCAAELSRSLHQSKQAKGMDSFPVWRVIECFLVHRTASSSLTSYAEMISYKHSANVLAGIT